MKPSGFDLSRALCCYVLYGFNILTNVASLGYALRLAPSDTVEINITRRLRALAAVPLQVLNHTL